MRKLRLLFLVGGMLLAMIPAVLHADPPTAISAFPLGFDSAQVTWSADDLDDVYRLDLYLIPADESSPSTWTPQCGTTAPEFSYQSASGGSHTYSTGLLAGRTYHVVLAETTDERACTAPADEQQSTYWVQESEQPEVLEIHPRSQTEALAFWTPASRRLNLDVYEGAVDLATCPRSLGGLLGISPIQRLFSDGGEIQIYALKPGAVYSAFAGVPPEKDEGRAACMIVGFVTDQWTQPIEDTQPISRILLENDTWIDRSRTAGYVFEDNTKSGYMLVVVGFDITLSIAEEDDVQFQDIASYSIINSPLGVGALWPTQVVQHIQGTDGWGRGLVLLYGQAYEALSIDAADRDTRTALITTDSSWGVRATPDALRVGPGVEAVSNFAPQIYLDDAAEIQRDIIQLLRWVESGHDVDLVDNSGFLTSRGAEYLTSQVDGIENLLPSLFVAAASTGPRAIDKEGTALNVEMQTGTRFQVGGQMFQMDYFGAMFADLSAVTGMSTETSAGFIIVIIGIVAAVLVTMISGNPAVGIPALILAMAIGSANGWIDVRWLGAAIALEAFAIAWAFFLKRA